MFDHSPSTTLDTTLVTVAPRADWKADLVRGDIVAFRFPTRDGTGAPKARPCLVIEVEMVGDTQLVTLAYGTSAPRGSDRRYEIRVDRDGEPEASGLNRPTRFQCALRLTVSTESGGFVLRPALRSPVIGRLIPRRIATMNSVRGRLHAEADIAAERRAERRRELMQERPALAA